MDATSLDVAQIALLADFDTPTIANALESLGLPGSPPMGPDIRAHTHIPKPIVGVAVTGTMSEKRGGKWEHLEGWIRFLEAVEATPVPVIAVLQDTSERPGRNAMAGEGMSRAMRACGAVGLICDGVNRDIQQIRALEFPTFCRGLAADRGNIRFHRYQIPVQIGELRVSPGDLLHADENGATIVPANHLTEILEAAARISAYEGELFRFFSAPDFRVARFRERMADALASAISEQAAGRGEFR